MKTLTTLTAAAAALLITGTAFASSTSSRNALAVIDTHRDFQDKQAAYALSGEEQGRVALQRGDHEQVNLVIDGGRNAR